MTTSSPLLNLPLPENADIIDATGTYGAYANGIDTFLVPRYASSTARDAANASGLTEGQASVVQDPGSGAVFSIYDGAAWQPFGIQEYVIKAADLARASTTTVTADPDLGLTLTVPGIYIVEAHIAAFTTSPTPGVRMSWIAAAGLTCLGRVVQTSAQGNPASIFACQLQDVSSNVFTTTYNTSHDAGLATAGIYVTDVVTVRADSSGTLSWGWAQAQSNGNATTVKAKSHLVVKRVS